MNITIEAGRQQPAANPEGHVLNERNRTKKLRMTIGSKKLILRFGWHNLSLTFKKDSTTGVVPPMAWLYREMCHTTHLDASEIAGPLILLQVWEWERLPFLAPRRETDIPWDNLYPLGARWRVKFKVTQIGHNVVFWYREMLDRMSADQFISFTYIDDELRHLIPTYCYRDQHIWDAKVPLIYFYIVEYQKSG
ncbi:serine/threonine-protein phosphatase 7 long form-like [Quillaja saponaria]|uniref:Serine/threonine-protein phosphatase 7 long form-like n=1 Tax=Quillaja saponaria TaxID=32244 RepID=A0AAD7L3P7_QUISA|nr:serine/threonine-protein phosphatase 7 long form-like [Quillaja saponaria]